MAGARTAAAHGRGRDRTALTRCRSGTHCGEYREHPSSPFVSVRAHGRLGRLSHRATHLEDGVTHATAIVVGWHAGECRTAPFRGAHCGNGAGRPVNVVVIHQSRTGNTRRAAELIGGAAALAGATVAVRPVTNIDYKELAEADLVFVGTWVDGLILFGHRPGDTGKVRQIPKLWDKKVAAFMTHAVNPGNAADKFSALLEGHGAEVVAARSLNRRRLEDEAPAFATEVLASVSVSA